MIGKLAELQRLGVMHGPCIPCKSLNKALILAATQRGAWGVVTMPEGTTPARHWIVRAGDVPRMVAHDPAIVAHPGPAA